MSKHPNLQVIEKLFAAYAAKDVGRVREALAPDIVWRIPGHHPRGRKARGRRGACVLRPAGQRELRPPSRLERNGGLDMTWCLVFRLEGGRIKEVTNFAADQHKADLFFWSTYRLKPIPDRLA